MHDEHRSPGNAADRERATAEDILAPKHEMPCGCCGYLPCYWRRTPQFDRGEPLSATKAALKVVR